MGRSAHFHRPTTVDLKSPGPGPEPLVVTGSVRSRWNPVVRIGLTATIAFTAACAPPPPTAPGPTDSAPVGPAAPLTCATGVAGSSGTSGTSGTPGPGSAPLEVLDGAELADATIRAATAAEADPRAGRVAITSVDADGEVVVRSVDATAAGAAVLLVGLVDEIALVEVDHPVSAVGVAGSAGATVDDPLFGQQWAFTELGFHHAWVCSKGVGVDIAIVDSGVDSTHEDLAGAMGPTVSILGGVTTAGAGGVDPNGHGTHVASVAAARAGNGLGTAGVAPGARIMSARVLDASGNGQSADVAAAIHWARTNGAEVINLSLGGGDVSHTVNLAVDQAVAAGIFVVAAGGNLGADSDPIWPAAHPAAFAVGSVNSDGSVSQFSSRGEWVELVAPGSGIVAAAAGGGYTTKWGTSMAAPHVSGLVALMRGSDPGLTAPAIASRLRSTATDRGRAGWDPAYGWGVVDPVSAVSSP